MKFTKVLLSVFAAALLAVCPSGATVPSSSAWLQYTYHGPSLPVTFVFQNAGDLQVLDTRTPAAPVTLTLNSDYSVSGGAGATGTVAIIPGGAHGVISGDVITISRAVPLTQTTSFTNTGPLTASMIGQALDKLTEITQQQATQLAVALQFPGDETTSGLLPLEVRKNKILAFDSLGNLQYISTSAIGPGGGVIAGTANEVQVVTAGTLNTISLPAAMTFTGKTVTGGTFTGGTMTGLTVATVTTASNTGLARFIASNDVNTTLNVQVYGSAYPGTYLGINRAGAVYLNADGGADPTAFVIGSPRNIPIIIATNGAEVGRFTTDGLTTVWFKQNAALFDYFIAGGNNTVAGGHNIGMGYQTLLNQTSGGDNVALGYQALKSSTTASNNTAVGSGALQNVTTSYDNTAVGFQALNANTSGTNNSAFGDQSLYTNSTGSANTAVGLEALRVSTTGDNNTAVGVEALNQNTTGNRNTAVGLQALSSNSTSSNNVAVGYLAMGFSGVGTPMTGGANTAVGFQAMEVNLSGTNNVAIGQNALLANTTGSSNVAVGFGAGVTQVANGTSTFLGNGADSSTPAVANATALGNGATVTTSNQMVYGNASVTQNIFHGASNRGGLTTLTYASPTSVTVSTGNVFKTTTVNATGSVTFNADSGGIAGQEITIIIVNDATSGKTITFGTNFKPKTTTIVGTTSTTSTIKFVSDGTSLFETARIINIP